MQPIGEIRNLESERDRKVLPAQLIEEKPGAGKSLSSHPLAARTHHSNDRTQAGRSTDGSPKV
jgi:hypothetical protein